MLRWILWIAAATCVLGPPILLSVKQDLYTPVLAAVVNGILFSVSVGIGWERAAEHAAKKANDRWLPGSEGAMDRLLSVSNDIERLKIELANTCKIASRTLPELENDSNRAIRILFSTICDKAGSSLTSIVNHLDGALADWTRFVEANCQGEDCSRIFRTLKQKKNKLDKQLREECCSNMCLRAEKEMSPISVELTGDNPWGSQNGTSSLISRPITHGNRCVKRLTAHHDALDEKQQLAVDEAAGEQPGETTRDA